MLAAYADHIWQSTVVAAGALLLLALCGPWLSARARRAIAWIALLKFALPAALFTSLVRLIDPPARHWLGPAPLFPAARLPVTVRAALANAASHPSHPLDVTLASLWAVGAAFVALSFLLRSLALRRRVAEAQVSPVPPALRQRITLAADRTGLARPPPGYFISANESPAAYGILSPALLIPRGIDSALDDEELDTVLLHECVHLARRDNLWAILQAMLLSLNWYNPLAWLLGRRIQLETEMRCDETVLAYLGDPEHYVGALAKAARHALGLLPPGSAPAGSTPLGIRLGNILAYHPTRRRPWLAAPAIGITACAVLLSGYAGSITAASALPQAGALAPQSGAVDPRSVLFGPISLGTPITVTLVGPDGAPLPLTGDSIVPPTRQSLPLPAYPWGMRKGGVCGSAVVEFTVDTTGAVQNPVLRNYDQPEFGSAAMLAVPSWKFIPARQNGRPVEARIRMRFNFWASPGPAEMPAELRQVRIDLQQEN